MFNILESFGSFKLNLEVGDKVYIHYWYDNHITICKVKEVVGRKYLLSHNVEESKIFNAPDVLVGKGEIIDKVR